MQGENSQSLKPLVQCIEDMDNSGMLGHLHLLMESGQLESAYNLCKVMPPQAVTLYILGQLSNGQDAINFYLRGAELDSNPNTIVSAYLSIVEVYMTDLCDDEKASENCNLYLDKCLNIKSNSSDLYFVMADVRLCQCDKDKAKAAVFTAMGFYINSFYTDNAENIPTYASRIKGAKVSIELNLIDTALEILKSCEYEFEEDLDMLYLSSFCYLLNSELTLSTSYLEKLKKFDTENEYSDGIFEIETRLSELKNH
eukprot:NODE_136_length_18060_cov_0.656645.p7 type:complete len:255 gc:universal NODE_136_length_18060_cov_0.656645:13690-12926(-)